MQYQMAGQDIPLLEQRDRMDKLQREGWCVALCWNWEAAARFGQGYAGLLKVVI